ncbi:hypothetical protein AG1IA_10150 [Rhizoctonia solani AG-1 IA]|uniref:Uncharacterized protein n=1 Tax=Thanatephorus cucumeris (strain AG1-IA) TaxID=983506 RepID=L8WD01_THACA|nr:hypothetical protein AG1IA_10150 [Rhizoctonia solani AG-1 IA]
MLVRLCPLAHLSATHTSIHDHTLIARKPLTLSRSNIAPTPFLAKQQRLAVVRAQRAFRSDGVDVSDTWEYSLYIGWSPEHQL